MIHDNILSYNIDDIYTNSYDFSYNNTLFKQYIIPDLCTT